MARRRFNVSRRALRRGLIWTQGSELLSPSQTTSADTQNGATIVLLDPSFLSIGSIQSEAEGWTVTRIVGALLVTSINDLATGVSVGWRWTFGLNYAGTLGTSPDIIEGQQGAEVDWLHTHTEHMSAHSALDFTPTWMQQPLLSYQFDVRVQRKLRAGGVNPSVGNYRGINAYFSVSCENLDVGETLDVTTRLTWRLLLRKPGR